MPDKEDILKVAGTSAASAILPYAVLGIGGYILIKKLGDSELIPGLDNFNNIAGGIVETVTNTTETITETVTETITDLKDSAGGSPFPETKIPRGGRTTWARGKNTIVLTPSEKKKASKAQEALKSFGGGFIGSRFIGNNFPETKKPSKGKETSTKSKTSSGVPKSKRVAGRVYGRTGKDITSERKNLSRKQKEAL